VAPWTARAEQITAAGRVNAEAEQQLVRLTAEVRDLSLEVKKRVRLLPGIAVPCSSLILRQSALL
jgi:hypothetical protein